MYIPIGAMITAASVVPVLLGMAFGAGMWVRKVNAGLNDMARIKDDIARIKQYIHRILGHIFGPEPAIGPGSPLTLTEHGKSISSMFGAQAWAEAKAAELVARVSGKEDYEIEQFCFDWIYGDFADSNEREADVARTAYQLGSPKAHVYDVLAVVLRDELISRRGGLASTGGQTPSRDT